MSFKLKVVTPFGVFFEGDIESLNICTKQGYLTILANHIPLISPLKIETMTFRVKSSGNSKNTINETRVCALAGGIMYVDKDQTKIIANACEYKEDIDINRALAAKERAEKRLEAKNENINIKRAEIALRKALNRINTYNNL